MSEPPEDHYTSLWFSIGHSPTRQVICHSNGFTHTCIKTQNYYYKCVKLLVDVRLKSLVSEEGLRRVEVKPTTFVTNLLGFTPYSVLNLAHLFRGSEPKQGGEKDESYIVVDMTVR